MECPECGNKMFKNDDVWECSNCGCTYVKNNKDNLFSKINASNISNKINHYRENNETAGKIINGVENVAEQVSIQAKKEHAYIKSRNDNDSTALIDDNEFFISKVVLDRVDHIATKTRENKVKKEKDSKIKNENDSKIKNGKEFEKKLKELCGGTLPNDAFDERARKHGTLTGIAGSPPHNSDYKDIMREEFYSGTLKIEDMEKRLDELFDLDVKTLNLKINKKNEDTSVFKTQEDLNILFGEEYAEEFRMKDKTYRKEALFKDYGINTDEAYCFDCTIEERRSSTFSNTDRRNVDNAYVAVLDDYIAIIKESVWLKSNMGMRKVYFNNVTSIDYDTSGKLGLSSSLFIHTHSGEHVQLKFVSKDNVDEVQKRYEKFLNEKDVPTSVQINQETSNADELLKYAELFKQGLLTEEEFEAKKKELL